MYEPLKRPWAHQQDALIKLEGRKWFALLMAMRTGKTKVTLDDFGRLEADGLVDDLLVIAPAGVYRTWEKAVKEHVGLALQKRLLIHVWNSAKKGHREQLYLSQFMNNELRRPRLLLINIEAISAVEQAFRLAHSFLNQRRCYMVIDESTTIKNDSIRTQRCLKLAPLAVYRRILTGLIAPRSPLDVFYQFEFLAPHALGFSTYAAFKARYANEVKVCVWPKQMLEHRLRRAIPKGRVMIDNQVMALSDLTREEMMSEMDRRGIWYDRFSKITGYKNETELRNKVSEHSYRARLSDCYDLPPKIYSMRTLEMTLEQKRIYKSLKETAIAELASMTSVTALSVVSRMIRLHQVLCGHVRDELNALQEIPERRTAALLELLQEHEGKAIIWCSYDYNVRNVSAALAAEFGPESVSRFWGGNVGTREAEEERFQTDPECRFMVGTPSAGGRGRLWVVADLVIYYSNTHNLEHRSQSEERAQGIDKVNSVAYVDLLVPGTVDEKIINGLREKIDMADVINGDNWREWLV